MAPEIRDLAERTSVSTAEIGSIVERLQKEEADAVAAMTSWSEKARQEVARSRVAEAALEELFSNAAELEDLVGAFKTP